MLCPDGLTINWQLKTTTENNVQRRIQEFQVCVMNVKSSLWCTSLWVLPAVHRWGIYTFNTKLIRQHPWQGGRERRASLLVDDWTPNWTKTKTWNKAVLTSVALFSLIIFIICIVRHWNVSWHVVVSVLCLDSYQILTHEWSTSDPEQTPRIFFTDWEVQ